MSVSRTYYCEGPGEEHGSCPRHAQTATPPPYIPISFIETREQLPGGEHEIHHFCSWDCLMKYAAKRPVSEQIPLEPAA